MPGRPLLWQTLLYEEEEDDEDEDGEGEDQYHGVTKTDMLQLQEKTPLLAKK